METTFDKKAFYHEKIQPLVEEIHQLCALHNIPCVMGFAVAEVDSKTEYAVTPDHLQKDAVVPFALNMDLAQNYIDNALIALNGGHFTLPGSDIDFALSFGDDDDEEDYEELDVDVPREKKEQIIISGDNVKKEKLLSLSFIELLKQAGFIVTEHSFTYVSRSASPASSTKDKSNNKDNKEVK